MADQELGSFGLDSPGRLRGVQLTKPGPIRIQREHKEQQEMRKRGLDHFQPSFLDTTTRFSDRQLILSERRRLDDPSRSIQRVEMIRNHAKKEH